MLLVANFRLTVLRTVLQATLFHCNLSDCIDGCIVGLMHFIYYWRRGIYDLHIAISINNKNNNLGLVYHAYRVK